MRKRSDKKRRQSAEREAPSADEFAGQQLSPEEQEQASLRRIMAEMGHHSGRKGKPHPKSRNHPPRHKKPQR